MTTVVRGAGRRKYERNRKHAQLTSLPSKASAGRDVATQHTTELKRAAKPKAAKTSKPQRLALALEDLGWEVKRYKKDDGRKAIVARRGIERITMRWDADQNFIYPGKYNCGDQESSVRNTAEARKIGARPAAQIIKAEPGKSEQPKKRPAVRRVNLEGTDEEVLAKLIGKRVWWLNTMTGGKEFGRVSPSATISIASSGKRILNFCDHRRSGYRAAYLDAILRVA